MCTLNIALEHNMGKFELHIRFLEMSIHFWIKSKLHIYVDKYKKDEDCNKKVNVCLRTI